MSNEEDTEINLVDEAEQGYRDEIKQFYFPEQEAPLSEHQIWEIIHRMVDKIVEGSNQNKLWEERGQLYENAILELETDIRSLIKELKNITGLLGLTEKDMTQKMSFVRKAQILTSLPDMVKKLLPKEGHDQIVNFNFLVSIAHKYKSLDDSMEKAVQQIEAPQ